MSYLIQKLCVLTILALLVACDTPQKTSKGNFQFSCTVPVNEELINNDCGEKMECSFQIHPESYLKVESYNGSLNAPSLERGNATVFYMNRKYQDNPNIADDEYREVFYLNLDNLKDYFHFEDEACEKINAIFGFLAFSRDGGYYPIKQGCIEGKKENEKEWHIRAQFEVKTRSGRTIPKSIDAFFTTQS